MRNINFEVNMFNEYVLDMDMDNMYIWDKLDDLIEEKTASELLRQIKLGLDVTKKYFIEDEYGKIKGLTEEEAFSYMRRPTSTESFYDWFDTVRLDKNGFKI